jgi:PhnB protein
VNDPWTLAPYLRVENAGEAISWYVRALGATETFRMESPDGRISHAELDVHGNKVCVADVDHDGGNARHVSFKDVAILLYAQVPDVDAVFNRAVEAGARVEAPLENKEYGERMAGFIDPYGNVWYVSTPIAR